MIKIDLPCVKTFKINVVVILPGVKLLQIIIYFKAFITAYDVVNTLTVFFITKEWTTGFCLFQLSCVLNIQQWKEKILRL